MDKSYIYVPFTFLVIGSVVLIALEMKYFNAMVGLTPLIKMSISLALLVTALLFLVYRKRLDFDNMYVLLGSSLLFSFVVFFGLGSYFNRAHATQDCEIASFKVLGYEKRFVSAGGKKKDQQIKANQWWLYIEVDGEPKRFVYEVDILGEGETPLEVEMKKCNGAFSSYYVLPK